MKTITLCLVLAVGLLTLMLWLLFGGGEGRRDAPSAAPSIKGEAGAEAGEAVTSALLDGGGEGAARAPIEAESMPEAAATEEEGQAPTNALAGRLTILDEGGGLPLRERDPHALRPGWRGGGLATAWDVSRWLP